MVQAITTLTLMLTLILAKGYSPAKRDVYRFEPVTRRTYAQQAARADRYSAQSVKSDHFLRMFGRRHNIKSDVTKRPTTRRYFGKYILTRRPTTHFIKYSTRRPTTRPYFRKYFQKYFTRRPTQRYNINGQGQGNRQPTQRPTQRPTPRRYGVAKTNKPTRVQRGVRRTGRPTKPCKVSPWMDEAKPNESNSTQEMVPEPELLDKKYFHLKSRLAWNDAQEACARGGAQLATIHSAEDHERVSTACQGECWLGAQRRDVTQAFKWADESAMDFDKWGREDATKTGLCAKMSESKWSGADCDDRLTSVCQKMEWKSRVEASVGGDYLTLPTSLVGGSVLSLSLMVMVVVVLASVAANYMCAVINYEKQMNDMDMPINETTPLLLTRD